MEQTAAHLLLNQKLKNGWTVIKKLERDANQSGSNFSVGYIVENENKETCFLKAFDIGGFLALASHNGDVDVIDVMNDMTTAFIYERDLSNHCKNKYVTNVSIVKEAGQTIVKNVEVPVVPYLIFDLANGDVRKHLNFSNQLDNVWKLKSLHDIAVGLRQLHQIEVSHQDLKPSNVLVYSKESKIGDLGRSMCRDIDGPYNRQIFTGDRNYAPPEIMYGYYENDWVKRVFATDCYLLGSLFVFYFLGISMNALLLKYLPENYHWYRWRGELKELIPYLNNAYTQSLEEIEHFFQDKELGSEIVSIIKYLCIPFPNDRIHELNRNNQNPYNLQRTISTIDLLRRKEEIKIKK